MSSTHPVPLWLRLLALAGATLAALGLAMILPGVGILGQAATLPEFKHATPEAWINSAPLTKTGLQGKVVLLEVYTSG